MADIENISISGYEMAMKVMDAGFGVKTDIEEQKHQMIMNFFDHFKEMHPDMKDGAYEHFSEISFDGSEGRSVKKLVDTYAEYEEAMFKLIRGE